MKVGALGAVPFKVSKNMVQTITSFTASGSAEYAAHKPRLKTPIPEFTGRNLKEASIEILLSQYLGCKTPIALHNKLQTYMREGTAIKLTTGTYTWGYKWVITSLQMTAEYYDRRGKVDQIRVVVNLLEYPKPAGVKKKSKIISQASVSSGKLSGKQVKALKASATKKKKG